MKTSIKNMLLSLTMVISFCSISSAQVNKTAVQSMMSQQGVTLDAIKKVYVYNVKKFYTDGTYKYVYDEYADLKYTLTEDGILIQGKSTQLFPFSSFKHFTVGSTSMTIHLMQ